MLTEDPSSPQPLFIKYEHSGRLFVAQAWASVTVKKNETPVNIMSTQKVNFP